jgi:hypothetical protein
LQKQTLFIPIQNLSITDGDGRGMFAGRLTLIGFLDPNYGGIFAPGCYDERIPNFLANGFVPDSHGAAQNLDYTILGQYGYFTKAEPREDGLWVEGKFHSDPDAQILRTRIRERNEDNKTVGMSLGWYTLESFRIYPKDYEKELPKYLAPEFLKQGLEEAKRWTSVQIRTKIDPIEGSLTLTPAQSPALVTEVMSKTETLGKYLGEWVESSMSLGQVSTLVDALYWNVAYKVFCDDQIPVEDRRAMWEGALEEFKQYNLQVFDNAQSWEANEATPDEENPVETAKRLFARNKDLSVLATLTMKQEKERALAAVHSYITRINSLADVRVKSRLSGKAVSKANWEDVKGIRDALSAIMDDHSDSMTDCIGKLDTFLDKYDPAKQTDSRQTVSDGAETEKLFLSFQRTIADINGVSR